MGLGIILVVAVVGVVAGVLIYRKNKQGAEKLISQAKAEVDKLKNR